MATLHDGVRSYWTCDIQSYNVAANFMEEVSWTKVLEYTMTRPIGSY